MAWIFRVYGHARCRGAIWVDRVWRGSFSCCVVGVLAFNGGSGERARVSGACRERRKRTYSAFDIIGDDDVREWHVTGIGHLIGPSDGVANGYNWAGWSVGIYAVRQLLDSETWLRAEVVAWVGRVDVWEW